MLAKKFIPLICLIPALAPAGEDPYSGDFWNRPTLLGDPGGVRKTLSESGIDLSAWVTQTPYNFLRGDGEHGWAYGGKATITGTFDGEKLGLWPGLSFQTVFESNFGEEPDFGDDGLLLPPNGIIAFPSLTGHDQDFDFNITQRFGERFSLSAGKFNLLHVVSRTPIMGGGGEETFLHAAFAGPVTGVIPPYFLGGIAKLTTDAVDYTLMVFDPRSATESEVLSNPFEDDVSISLAATLKTKVRGRSGYYGLRGVYSTAEGLDLSRVPELIGLPPAVQDTITEGDYWYVNASAYQYLYEDPGQPGSGWGLFAYAALSDGNPNPLQSTIFVGLAGNSPMEGRMNDKWGIGYFRYGISDDLTDSLKGLGLDIRDEQGMEIFYNFALTPWLQVTADLQWLEPFRSDRDRALLGTVRLRALIW